MTVVECKKRNKTKTTPVFGWFKMQSLVLAGFVTVYSLWRVQSVSSAPSSSNTLFKVRENKHSHKCFLHSSCDSDTKCFCCSFCRRGFLFVILLSRPLTGGSFVSHYIAVVLDRDASFGCCYPLSSSSSTFVKLETINFIHFAAFLLWCLFRKRYSCLFSSLLVVSSGRRYDWGVLWITHFFSKHFVILRKQKASFHSAFGVVWACLQSLIWCSYRCDALTSWCLVLSLLPRSNMTQEFK